SHFQVLAVDIGGDGSSAHGQVCVYGQNEAGFDGGKCRQATPVANFSLSWILRRIMFQAAVCKVLDCAAGAGCGGSVSVKLVP
ncbi:hypothetical protein QWU01_28130, partial [Kluyvera cryocrescens]